VIVLARGGSGGFSIASALQNSKYIIDPGWHVITSDGSGHFHVSSVKY
jgi:hypothetical protein